MIEAPERKRTYPRKLSIYLTEGHEDLYEQLRAFAYLRRWSESQAAIYLIEQALSREQKASA